MVQSIFLFNDNRKLKVTITDDTVLEDCTRKQVNNLIRG